MIQNLRIHHTILLPRNQMYINSKFVFTKFLII